MSIEQTNDRLRLLGLHGMVEALQQQVSTTAYDGLSFVERLGRLVDFEIDSRESRRSKYLLRRAKLRWPEAVPEDISYDPGRKLDRVLVSDLLAGTWLDKHQNTLITGSSGAGKTWLACALARQAIRQGRVVLFFRLNQLFEDIRKAQAAGSISKLRATLRRAELLILDDLGLSPLSADDKRELLEIIEPMEGRASIIVTAQMPARDWHAFIDDPAKADAILERLMHNAHRIELHGESQRKMKKKLDA